MVWASSFLESQLVAWLGEENSSSVFCFFAHFDFALEQVDGNGTIQTNVLNFAQMCFRSLEVVFAV